MFSQKVTAFTKRRESYARKLSFYETDKEPNGNEYKRIIDVLCKFLMNPDSAEDVAECFLDILDVLVIRSIPVVETCSSNALHRLNSVILGKLLRVYPNLLIYVQRYFDKNPAPFQPVEIDDAPEKRRRIEETEVSDYELVASCYNILCSAPAHFKRKWNWSKFYEYLAHEAEGVRWIAMNCIAVVLDMSESCYLSHINNYTNKHHEFSIEFKKIRRNIVTSEDTIELDEILDEPSVVSIGGILLPVSQGSTLKSELNLVPVPSTRRNLQNLALAVSSNKCVCLQGAVGSGKTALVEFLAQATGHDARNFARVQLGDQTDSKMLLGMYRCTDIPGEFLWEPGILTEAVQSGKWLLLEDIDCAATDVVSVVRQLVENKTLSVPGYRDSVQARTGFQLFVTRRLTSGSQTSQISLQKEWFCVNVESLSKDELVTIVQTMFPVLNTVATRLVDVYLLFSVARHEEGLENVVKNSRLISTRDLIKWCSRAVVDFDVSSPTSALKIFQDALDVFCCSVPNSVQRSNLAVAVAHKLGIVKTKAEYFCGVHKPTVNVHKECLIIGRAKLRVRKADRVKLESRDVNFSYTRPSVCLLERIASCVVQKEPVLLVGETGTGKTSCVQYLARITGHKLIVINMNQQSESTDLLGGYKPVDLKLLIRPIREEFEIVFRSYFEIKPNQKFLSHLARCFEDRKWKMLTTLMVHSTNAALRRLQASSKSQKEVEMLKKWQKIAQKLEKLQTQVQSQYSLAFSFVEGSLVKALKNGYWVLLDEINLATAETLECLSGLLEGSCGSLSLLERGDKEPIQRHEDFAIFACMNPATDIGKRDLPVGLRNRFTEFFVDELTEKSDLQLLVNSYLKDLNLSSEKIAGIVKFYLNVRKEAETSLLDGTGHKPHYSLRTLCRALSVSAKNPCANALRSLYEAFCLSFLTQLDSNSYPLVQRMIVKAILGEKTASAVIGTPIPRPRGHDSFICFEGYWIPKGDLEPQKPGDYILTETVRQNLKDLVRVVSIGKMPVLLQGDTSVGKTSLITYLAKASGHTCVRINNHEHTDLQEYVGTYVADSTGRLVFKEGVLVDAMRKGHWIILDELNLAPSDVLEALNRVLDDNRELFIPETQQVVKAHENFMLFATQNPPGLYGGRKILSRAFRNRFVELHFDEIPPKELQVILQKRCKMPETYCKQVINVMTELQLRRKSTATFAGKKGFITLRDLFRWAERYHLAPDTGTSLYDWSQHLADEGYLVLSSKVRRQEECLEIIQVLKKHLKRDVDPEALFSLSEKTSTVTKPILQSLLSREIPGFEHLVWTFQMRKMAVLLSKACDFKEPVLLIGETGGGKTTVCQLLAAIRKQRLSIVNCHMHTEASDFLGSLRPVREHQSQKLFEWIDGPLVNAMKNGGFFVVDEISLADDSVLERLNSLLEPERKLLIAEKQSDEENETVTAHENFIFVGTMNPGGDYGKKELSPALRNRFTEIWCEGCVSSDDLRSIMTHNLREELKETFSTAIIQFIEWLKTTEMGKKLVVSVRDILTWVNFVNCCEDFETGDALFHGAALSYIDGLGSGLTAAENPRKLKDFKESALKFIQQQVQSTLKSKLTLNHNEFDVENREGKFGIPPFYIRKGNESIPGKIGFAFNNPTTRSNTLKVLRALQLKKPILLEGSPGVGKTSLVSALARASGHRLLRLNLSDQTDVSDLFGADLPVEGGKPGEFSWRDGPFLRALKNGDWILLDELNLASQSVLEGLNACLDHRGEVYIPELGMSFVVKPGTRLFGCQNPLRQGGGRRGLPKSFLNRFTQVFVDTLENVDLQCILKMQFTELPGDLIDKMIQFNEELSSQAGTTWGHSGSPWEMNLRDLTRWCEITIANFKRDSKKRFNIGNGAQLIYVDRMRTVQDKNNVKEIYGRIFGPSDRLPEPEFPIHLTKERLFLGDEILGRSDFAVHGNDDLLLLREQKTVLKGLAQCVNMNWMAILIGGSGTGKTSLVHLLANLAGQRLKSIVVNSAMDTTEILGGFEQTDYNRHLEELLERTEALLIKTLRKNLDNKNLEKVAHYHGLLENVRRLFEGDDKTTGTCMSTETKLFLRKTEELSKLVSAMGPEADEELAVINKKLDDLSIAVERDNCLNAGGKFEWVDSVLVKNGTWLLLDQVNRCSPAILDRLNGLLEPNGALTIGEKGVDPEGNVFTVKAHENFRLFLTMDPRHGEISRAMRNRGVEICIPTPESTLPSNPLDVASLLNICGIRNIKQQKLLVEIHETIHGAQYRLNEMLQVASFISQQMAKGFGFFKSLRNAFRELCGSLDHRSKKEALSRIEEILLGNSKDESQMESPYDLDSITLTMSELRCDSRLALIEQQGFLLKSIVETLTNERQEIVFQDLLGVAPVGLPYLKQALLDFYERSLSNDLEVRRAWSSRITSRCELGSEINECLGNEAASLKFLFENKSAAEVPLGFGEPSATNNFAIVLYFRLMMLECRLGRISEANEDVIRLEEYSAAVRSGKLSSNLKNMPLILNFSNLVEQSSKFIHLLLRNADFSLTDKEYVELRNGLRWYQRYQNLGSTKLIDKARGTFYDLKEISSLLEVHYKWLRKFIKKLLAHYSLDSLSLETRKEIEHFSNTCLNELTNNDDYEKFRKAVKKLLPIPSAHLSESSMRFDEKLRSVSRRLQMTDEDLIDASRTKWKIIVLAGNLSVRKRLIETCEKQYKDKLDKHRDWSRGLTEIEEIAASISEPKEGDDKPDKIDINVEAWPVYEFFFLLSTYRFLKQFTGINEDRCRCEEIYKDDALRKFEEIPTIPAGLVGLIKTLNSRETSLKQGVFLLPELLSFFFGFAQRSFAIENSHVLLNWRDVNEILELHKESNSIHNSTLFTLIFDLLSSKSGINFGNYKNRRRLFDTLRALLWKNSLVLNSPEFDGCQNDASLLLHRVDYYLSRVDKVLDTFHTEYNNREQNEEWHQFLKALRTLREIKDRSSEGLKAIDRGIGWLALGYLQVFLFRDPGAIDPVEKIVLKSKYAREDVSELKQLMLIEEIQCSILGTRLSDERKSSREDRLAKIRNKANSSEWLDVEDERYRRSVRSFQDLRECLENFSSTVGSYETIFCHVERLKKASESKKGPETLQVALIWKKSLERLADKLEKNFLVDFPDLVSPVITATSNLRHGASILIEGVKHFMNSTSRDVNSLLRFPVSYQQDYMSLVERNLRMYSRSESVCKEELQLVRISLKEMENFSAIARHVAWDVLQKVLKEIRNVWTEQETRRETLAREKESLYDMKVATKLEEEEDYEKTFPDHQQDFVEFSDLQKPLNDTDKASDDKETFVELISTIDARIIQEMHWNILNNCSGEDPVKIEPDFVCPLVQRFEIYGPHLRTVQDSRLVSGLLVLIAGKSNFGERNARKGVYDFYRDPNVAEVDGCQDLFDKLESRVNQFLEEWPENPILNSIKLIVDRLLGFPVDSSLSKFLIGVELLLTKIKQWEENARHDVSLAEFVEAFGEKVLRWRKLEISRWRDSLEVLEDDLKAEASKWWFFLFDLVDEYSDESSNRTVESLERFLTESPLIEYETRLRLIFLFYRHVRSTNAAGRGELSRILWNVYLYYRRFLNDVQAKIQALKEPIAKKVKDTIKITRWNDVSYWSVRNTAEKTRRTLHKFVKEFKKGLQQNVACCLTVKPKVEPLEAGSGKEPGARVFLIEAKTGRLNKTEKLGQKARRFCEEIVTSGNYGPIRKDIETFIEESLEESRRLRNAEVDKSLTKAKQQAQLKSILQQKKMALANHFKALSRLGISYRKGILAWKNRKETVINFKTMVLDLERIQRLECGGGFEDLDSALMGQWTSCEKYYYESLVKLNSLDSIFSSGRSVLEMQDAERCRGFSAHLMLLAHRQKETIADFFDFLLPFRIQAMNLTLMMKGTRETTDIVNVPGDLVERFQELLVGLEISIRQIIIVLESCPVESLADGDSLDLNETVVPVLQDGSVARELIGSMRDSLHLVRNLAKELNAWIAASRPVKEKDSKFLFHRRHLEFLREGYQTIDRVKVRLDEVGRAFQYNHPIYDGELIKAIDDSSELFKSMLECIEDLEEYEIRDSEDFEEHPDHVTGSRSHVLNALIKQILLAIQKSQENQKSIEEIDEVNAEDFKEGLMTNELIESLRNAVQDLRLATVWEKLSKLVDVINSGDDRLANKYMRLLSQYVPLLQQYALLLHYYLYEQVASFRLTCKFLYLQLNVFLDLATNGFCQPDNADGPEDEGEGGTAEGGMGLTEGEGKNDVSDRIESEDQLEDARKPNEEEEKDEKRETKEEEKGIEMSENFEGQLEDLGEREENEDDEEEEDLDKEMGETDETAEKLNEEIWKDEDEENNEEEDREDQKEERGTGEKTGQEELGAREDSERNNKDEEQGDGERKEEEKKEINEFEEPEMDDDQVDPYHGNTQPEVEPEAFDLPEDVNLDEEGKEEEGGNEEDPFDIDQMKESKLPEEKEEEPEEAREVEDNEEQNSSGEEDEDGGQEDGNKKGDEKTAVDPEEDNEKENEEQDETEEGDKAPASFDASSKQVDASEEVESKKDGSRDAVESQSNQEQMEVDSMESNVNENKDKGTGQSETKEREGHSGAKQEENATASSEEKVSKPVPQRRNPGKSDEKRSLLDDDAASAPKKLKTDAMHQNVDQEEREKQKGGESEAYEHIENSEKFDDYVLDAATEEQIKKQASNLEEEKEEERVDDDVEMHEDTEEPMDRDEETRKETAEKAADGKKDKSTSAKGDRSDEVEQIELAGEVEGETVETVRVLRGNESSIHTKLDETESPDVSTMDIVQKRSEIESMLAKWSQGPSSVEAANAWSSITALTESAARELSEKLRLVLEPTLTSRLKGDYRTGRRINMRKVIPYIASEFRKDKIWLRRTRPSKRDYRIVLAIDDSSSMADNHSKELAFESLSLIGKAMTYLEVGQLAVVNFGERVTILHPFGENFTDESGARLIQEMKFDQKKTMIGELLDFVIEMFASQGNTSEDAKLVTILSDGRGMFSEGVENVSTAVRRAKLLNIFLVFIIVDNPLNKDSILDIRMPIFEGGKLLGIRSYMDSFPFPFYIILRDLDTLPAVLSDALRQWFEIVGRIDT